MSAQKFEQRLSGGHHNSLGDTLEVVNEVLADMSKLAELYDCYKSDDELVRLRVSNAMKRVCREQPRWLVPYIDGMLDDISKIDQASTKWTLAQLFVMLNEYMDDKQRESAIIILKHNLEMDKDWIVQNTTMESLAFYAKQDANLVSWLTDRLKERLSDTHKSVARRADKLLTDLNAK